MSCDARATAELTRLTPMLSALGEVVPCGRVGASRAVDYAVVRQTRGGCSERLPACLHACHRAPVRPASCGEDLLLLHRSHRSRGLARSHPLGRLFSTPPPLESLLLSRARVRRAAQVDMALVCYASLLSNVEMLSREGVEPTLLHAQLAKRLRTVPAALQALHARASGERTDTAYHQAQVGCRPIAPHALTAAACSCCRCGWVVPCCVLLLPMRGPRTYCCCVLLLPMRGVGPVASVCSRCYCGYGRKVVSAAACQAELPLRCVCVCLCACVPACLRACVPACLRALAAAVDFHR